MKKRLVLLSVGVALAACLAFAVSRCDLRPHEVGEAIDSYEGVAVYYNGRVADTFGKSLGPDGYYIGHKYQCVEFVKRFYWERYRFRMPDPYGDAKDFFKPGLRDGAMNTRRGLRQYANGSPRKPRAGDILVLGPYFFNKYGHVAIISKVGESSIEVVQQNPGPYGKTRVAYPLSRKNKKWRIGEKRILGWLSVE
jgi:hypothetical protein